ncbi:MAG: hypothetical protein JJ974_11660 [Phycisphaerales bacterium]|nr:hypothetical protein [Phycisphaerales bacterium]
MITTRLPRLCLLLLGFCTLTSHAQDDLLRGPDLDAQTPTTIVRYSMSGDFEQLQGRPEMSAFAAVVDQTMMQNIQEQAIEIELQRTIELSLLLIDEIDLMKESTDALRAGDQKAAREIQAQLHEMFDPKKRHDPLSPELIKLLDDEQRKEYKRILEQYWESWTDWVLRDRDDRDKTAVRKRARQRLTRRLFEQELAEAYEISIKRYRDALEAIYAAIEPTDEQREDIREIVIEHIKAMRNEASPQQRRETMHEIYAMLDEERRTKLFDYLLRIAVPGDE